MTVVGIPPDISYGLECSVEGFDITSDVITYYHRFNETPLAPLVDNRRHDTRDIGESLRTLSRLYMSLYNDWYWTKAEPVEQAWCVTNATDHYGRASGEKIDYLITKYISDMLRESLDPERRAHQQQWMDRSRHVTHSEKIAAQLARKSSVIPAGMLDEALGNSAEFALRIPALPYEPVCSRSWDLTATPLKPHVLKKKRQARNKVLKKSAEFLSSLIGPKDVTIFIMGGELRVEGERHTFAIRKSNILSETHGAMTISVHHRASDKRLFNLCWYVDSTPALDQVSALVLAVRAGDEEEVIRIGNMLRVDHNAVREFRPDLSVERAWDDDLPGDVADVAQNLAAFGDRIFPDDDTMMRFTKGTTEYHRSHPGLYLDFSRRMSKRLTRRFPEAIRPYFVPDEPQTIRPFVDGRVGRDLLRGQSVQFLPTPTPTPPLVFDSQNCLQLA